MAARRAGPGRLGRMRREAAAAAQKLSRAASKAARPFKREVAKIQRDVKAAARAEARAKVGAPPVHAVKSDVGIGKSAEMRERAATLLRRLRAAGDKRTVAIAVPTHVLGTEQATLFEAEPDAIAAGLRAAVWRGRAGEDPDRPGDAMCQDLDAIKDAQEALADPQTAVCRKVGPDGVLECPFFHNCAYQRQRSVVADVWFAAHELLFLHKPAALGDLAMVVVDESAWQDGLAGDTGNHVQFSLDALNQADHVPGSRGDTERLRYLRDHIHEQLIDLPDGPIPRTAVVKACVSPQNADEAWRIEWLRKVDPGIRPNMPTHERKAAVRAAATNRTITKLASFWRAVEALARDDGPEASGWAALATADTKDGPVRVIRLKSRKPVGTGWDVPTLLIDAILQIDLVRPFWPAVVVTADIQVQVPHQHIWQACDRSFSKARMAKPTALRDVHAIICRQARWHAPNRVLVVTQRDTEEALPHVGPLPVNVELAHHNAIAGRDVWGPGPNREGVSLEIVVGRTAPPPAAVERRAEALTGGAITPMPGWYETADAVRETADGATRSAATDRHPHPVVEAIRWQVAEGELVQIIGRPRGVNRTAANPVEIIVMTDTPLPVPVQKALAAADMVPSPEDLMMGAGAMALASATDAALAYPGLWSTRDAAKKAMERFREPILGTIPCKYSLIRICPQDRAQSRCKVRIDYQRRGHGQRPSVAWVDLNLIEDPEKWLTQRLGRLAWCKVDEPAPAADADEPAATDV